MKKTNAFTRLLKSVVLLASIMSIAIEQGCSSSGGGSTPADADPKGYYDAGSAAVKLSDDMTDLAISDLQGMVSGNRFMFSSEAETILYDGTITDITGTSFTGTVDIYEDGVKLAGTTTVAGTITTASAASRIQNDWVGTI